MATYRPFDPLSYDSIAEAVVRALMRQPLGALPPPEKFDGAGVYAIYYRGDFRPYQAARLRRSPIYVGKADLPGSRKSSLVFPSESPSPEAVGSPLYDRLRQHAGSIEAVRNLGLEQFRCRFLVVVPIWVRVAEALLIRQYWPLWNVVVSGFGIHDPGRGRARQMRSDWDMLHPGRQWANRLPPGRPVRQIEADIAKWVGTVGAG